MEIYEVGGAVRDTLLGLPIHDRDFVVVGASPETMTQAGYLPVGRNFPVFLHPLTHEEFALARTERKTGKGHQGFIFHAHEKVTLEEDLSRRDLTINAIARHPQTHEIIDPFHGRADLENRILRHVAPAFREDPLRILRLARFRASLGAFNFTIAPETLALMKEMVQENALSELSSERIWQEVCKALSSPFPALFFITLNEIQALAFLFPALTQKGIEALMRAQNETPLIRFAALSFEGPHALSPPKNFEDLHCLVHQQLGPGQGFETQAPSAQNSLLNQLDHLRRPERFQHYLRACCAIDPAFPDADFLRAHSAIQGLNMKKIAQAAGPDSKSIQSAILTAEIDTLTQIQNNKKACL